MIIRVGKRQLGGQFLDAHFLAEQREFWIGERYHVVVDCRNMIFVHAEIERVAHIKTVAGREEIVQFLSETPCSIAVKAVCRAALHSFQSV